MKLLWNPLKETLCNTLDELDAVLEDVEFEAGVAEKIEASSNRVQVQTSLNGIVFQISSSTRLIPALNV